MDYRFENLRQAAMIDEFEKLSGERAFIDELEKIAKEKGMSKLKKYQVPLTDEERKEVVQRKATWNHGPNGEPTPAVWKSIDKHGKTIYVTNTHRAFNTATTLRGAISRYHKFIKSTA
jgi:hypothetical protein